jgi:FkbM family methyltransferase
MFGLVKNLVAIAESDDLPRRGLAASYARLRLQRALGSSPRRARLLGFDVAYQNFGALVELYEEIFLRRHYPFRPARPSPFVVDCGANIGVATLFFKAVAPDARVLAFEPEPTAYGLLQENVRRNGLADVECFQVALARERGEAALHVPAPASGGSTVHLAHGADWSTIPVHTEPLSQFIGDGRLDFLKLDVEGAEAAILDELRDSGTLERVEELVFEHHPGAPVALPSTLATLASAGLRYRIAVVGDRFWDPGQLLLVHAFRSG